MNVSGRDSIGSCAGTGLRLESLHFTRKEVAFCQVFYLAGHLRGHSGSHGHTAESCDRQCSAGCVWLHFGKSCMWTWCDGNWWMQLESINHALPALYTAFRAYQTWQTLGRLATSWSLVILLEAGTEAPGQKKQCSCFVLLVPMTCNIVMPHNALSTAMNFWFEGNVCDALYLPSSSDSHKSAYNKWFKNMHTHPPEHSHSWILCTWEHTNTHTHKPTHRGADTDAYADVSAIIMERTSQLDLWGAIHKHLHASTCNLLMPYCSDE